MIINYKNNTTTQTKVQVQAIVDQWRQGARSFTLQTSGSTGPPKSITLSREVVSASAQATINYLQLHRGTRALCCLPVNKVAGFMMVIRALLGNWHLTVTEPSAQALASVDGENFDFTAMVPHQVAQSWADLNRVEKILIGGGPIMPALENKLKTLKQSIYHSYGMTETVSHVAVREIAPNFEKDYRAVEGVSFKINDENCLLITAPHLELHQLVTTDLVSLKSETTFFWRGRIDNAIVVAGSKYFPEEIEKQINWTASNFMVFGRPHETLGEEIALVFEQEQIPSPAELETTLDNLAKRQRPKQIFTLPQFCYTSNGKLQRQATKALLES